MRELTSEEMQYVRGGSCADLEGFGWSTFGGAMGGLLRGAAAGPWAAVANAIYGGAISGAMYLITHDGPCS